MEPIQEEFYSAGFSEFPTKSCPFEIACGSCHRPLFVDQVTRDQFERALTQDVEGRFLCSECELEDNERIERPE